jgi:hypothetical protein
MRWNRTFIGWQSVCCFVVLSALVLQNSRQHPLSVQCHQVPGSLSMLCCFLQLGTTNSYTLRNCILVPCLIFILNLQKSYVNK